MIDRDTHMSAEMSVDQGVLTNCDWSPLGILAVFRAALATQHPPINPRSCSAASFGASLS